MDKDISSVPALEATQEQMKGLLTQVFSWIACQDISATSSLREDLNIDSLHMVELQLAIEDHFGIQLDPLDERLADAFNTVGHLARYVQMLRDEGGVT